MHPLGKLLALLATSALVAGPFACGSGDDEDPDPERPAVGGFPAIDHCPVVSPMSGKSCGEPGLACPYGTTVCFCDPPWACESN